MKHKLQKIALLCVLLATSVSVDAAEEVGIEPETTVKDVSTNPSLLKGLWAVPVFLGHELYALLSTGTNFVLESGAKVVENTGLCLCKVGRCGDGIIAGSHDHKIISGVAGLGAVYLVLTRTNPGCELVKRVKAALGVLVYGVNDNDSLDDHVHIARRLNHRIS